MASYRYTRDFKQDDNAAQGARQPMTAKQKRQNFWFYYKWHVIGILVVIAVIVFTVMDLAGRVEPDYTIGVITFEASTTDMFESLQEPFASFGEDLNGDGAVVVDVAQYDLASEDPQVIMADTARLMGDFQTSQSIFFLTDNVEKAQNQLGAFAYNDGSVPAEGEDVDYSRMGIAWKDCPALTALELGNAISMTGETDLPMQELMSDFSIVQRMTPDKLEKDEELAAYWNAGKAFYEKVTQGAA